MALAAVIAEAYFVDTFAAICVTVERFYRSLAFLYSNTFWAPAAAELVFYSLNTLLQYFGIWRSWRSLVWPTRQRCWHRALPRSLAIAADVVAMRTLMLFGRCVDSGEAVGADASSDVYQEHVESYWVAKLELSFKDELTWLCLLVHSCLALPWRRPAARHRSLDMFACRGGQVWARYFWRGPCRIFF